ncbi:hypothetical protein CO657_11105 [Rhizobium acidisoli]|uniref:Transmembrane protein n=1 Tax=Rhizobium acidisoli TaxID=1538158 RepID=A0AAE5TVH7_9HYPH|nr:hypothetical protein [Rhizobium acidisoli]KPH05042.1 hypothetical protein AOG23_30105 [Rhizobium acidisoli]QAS78582.1 hypothetical protein CO657_11105 [Rhizobium acidisoli]
MLALARVWTWVGTAFIPLAITWALFVQNALPVAPPAQGVLISRGYWGLVITLLTAAVLVWALGLYVGQARTRRDVLLIPPNTNFEEMDARSPLVSLATAVTFCAFIIAALAIFGSRYATSEIYDWNAPVPLSNDFWVSRTIAHQHGCVSPPCFAISQRMNADHTPIFGVHEYVLYVTDGILFLLLLGLATGVIYLAMVSFRSVPSSAAEPEH